mgnify:CR=1 FL=1
MTEIEYIRATNEEKVSLALDIMRDVLAGDDYGITAQEKIAITVLLARARGNLSASYKVESEE